MTVQQVVLLVVICVSVSHSLVVSDSSQSELLEYKTRVNTVVRLLEVDCEITTNLSSLSIDDRDILKFQYQRLLQQLSQCYKDKAKEASTGEELIPL